MGGIARADTLTTAAYRERLAQVLALVERARAAPLAEREPILAQARGLLRQTTDVELESTTLTIDDGPFADRLTPDAVEREATELGRYLAVATASLARRVDAAAADAKLRSLTTDQQLAQRLNLGAIVGGLLQRFGAWLYDLIGRPDPNVLLNVQAVIGVLVALAIVALLIRGTRERIRNGIPEHAYPIVNVFLCLLRSGFRRDDRRSMSRSRELRRQRSDIDFGASKRVGKEPPECMHDVHV